MIHVCGSGQKPSQNNNYMYLTSYSRVEQNNNKAHRNKLATIEEGPYKATKVDSCYLKFGPVRRQISQTGDLLIPKPQSEKKDEKMLKPISIDDKETNMLSK